jgi:hypothetical protein
MINRRCGGLASNGTRRRSVGVVLVGVAEDGYAMPQTLDHLVGQLAWHGIAAEACVITVKATGAAAELPIVAANLHADLLVVGGFGHGPLRELVFGGVTRSLTFAINPFRTRFRRVQRPHRPAASLPVLWTTSGMMSANSKFAANYWQGIYRSS